MRPVRLAVLISGRGSNLAAILDHIERGALAARVHLVVSNRAEAPGLEIARRAGVPTFVATRAEYGSRQAQQQAMLQQIEGVAPDLVVLAGFDQVLLPFFVQRFPARIINVHPALLPAFGGDMHGVQRALEHGVKVSGCTVHFVTEEVDAGPIILQAAVPVEEDDTVETLAARIREQEHRLLPRAIQLFAEGRLSLEGRRVRILAEATAVG